MRLRSCIIILTALLAIGCSHRDTVEMLGSSWMFLVGADTHELPSREWIVAVELTPAEDRDGEKMCKLLRSGHHVLLRLREKPDDPPMLVSSVTDGAVAIIECKSFAEAQKITERIYAVRNQR
jgi:hypothetical protein